MKPLQVGKFFDDIDFRGYVIVTGQKKGRTRKSPAFPIITPYPRVNIAYQNINDLSRVFYLPCILQSFYFPDGIHNEL